LAIRSRLVLLSAEGKSNTAIAATLSVTLQWVSGGGVIWSWVSMVWSMSRVPVRDWLAKDHASTYTSPDIGELAPHLTRPFRIMSTDSIPPVFAMRFETNRSP
jgi:hypothetical protein